MRTKVSGKSTPKSCKSELVNKKWNLICRILINPGRIDFMKLERSSGLEITKFNLSEKIHVRLASGFVTSQIIKWISIIPATETYKVIANDEEMKAGILLKILKHFCFLNTEPLISRFRPERVKFRKRFRIAKSRQVSFTSGRLTLESGGRIKLRPAFVPASLAKKLSWVVIDVDKQRQCEFIRCLFGDGSACVNTLNPENPGKRQMSAGSYSGFSTTAPAPATFK